MSARRKALTPPAISTLNFRVQGLTRQRHNRGVLILMFEAGTLSRPALRRQLRQARRGAVADRDDADADGVKSTHGRQEKRVMAAGQASAGQHGLDELEEFVVPAQENHVGRSWNLNMLCWVNGKQVSAGNVSEMNWTFAEIIERASYGVDLYPGDVIGSGTVGTGCFLELNGTGKLNDPNYQEQWLQEGDVVEMEIDGLGRLSNTIVREEDDFSILAKKKI